MKPVLTTIQKRARRKYLTYSFIISLANLKSPLRKSYWNTYHCCKDVWHNPEISDRYLAKYCKNRWCLVCASIRTAVLINTYMPIVAEWQGKSFLTLTVRNCSGEALRSKLKEMNKVFYNAIHDGRRLKIKKIDVKAIKKMETTYNTKTKEYHPHFHVITETREQAEYIRNYWLKHFDREEANELCQKVVPAENKGMKELFKYFTKIITEGNPIPPENLNEIFCAIQGMHTIRPYGFKVSLPDDTDKIETEFDVERIELAENEAIEVFGWEQEIHDWVSKRTGECLSGYKPSKQFESLVKQFEKKG